MHTVRNRLASRPPVAVPSACVSRLPNHADKRPAANAIPLGSMAVPLAVADACGLIEQPKQRRRNPKGKKARKAAARMAAVREAQLAASAEAPQPAPRARGSNRKAKGKANTQGKARPESAAKARPEALDRTIESPPSRPIQPEQLPAIAAAWPPLGSYVPHVPAPATRPALAPRAEPEVRAFLLPAVPEPLVEAPALPDEAEAVPLPEPEPALALAALVDAPLPRARALVPARRQGLIDVIAFLLRDSGRRLARWSARRHQTREEQAALRRAEARQINLQRGLEALDMLRRHRG